MQAETARNKVSRKEANLLRRIDLHYENSAFAFVTPFTFYSYSISVFANKHNLP